MASDDTWLPAVASRRILACRDTLAAASLTRFAGLHPTGGIDFGVQSRDLPRGISVRAWAATPSVAHALDPDDLHALHDAAVHEAWCDGAWDMEVTSMPPIDGPNLGLVTASVDWSACPDHTLGWLIKAANRGLLMTWFWLPMRRGPELRRRTHVPRDSTLQPDGGRLGAPPDRTRIPDSFFGGAKTRTIRLGMQPERKSSGPRRRLVPPATERQIRCIYALSLALGHRPDIPAGLTIREASAWIGSMKAGVPSDGR